MATPLLQVVAGLDPQDAESAGRYACDVARELGGAVLSLSPGSAEPVSGRHGITARPRERAGAAWRRALNEVRPQAVFVQDLGAAHPALLLDLRERGIPYAVFLRDFTPLCPTHKLWHRRDEPCSGPGRTGWKCAWCVSGTRRRALDLPLRAVRYRHRPRDWRTALLRADVLIAPSRFARDFWIAQGAPPERIAVIAPHLLTPAAQPLRGPAEPACLFYAADGEPSGGAELLAAALDHLRRSVRIEVAGHLDVANQARFRAAVAPRHTLAFHGALPPEATAALLAACHVVAIPTRWEQPCSRLVAEAHGAGARVVATAAGGVTEQIIHGVNGYLAARGDPVAFAESLREAFAAAMRGRAAAEAWAEDRVARNAQAASAAALEQLRRLLRLLVREAPDIALALEHAAWLDDAAAANHLSSPEASRRLITALRRDPEDETLPWDGGGFAARARAGSWQRRVDLNHAIAFFRGCGCRRIAHLTPPSSPAASDAEEWFAAWGLEKVAPSALPDGVFGDAGAAPATDPARLRLRFPRAHALVVITSEGIATHGGPPEAD